MMYAFLPVLIPLVLSAMFATLMSYLTARLLLFRFHFPLTPIVLSGILVSCMCFDIDGYALCMRTEKWDGISSVCRTHVQKVDHDRDLHTCAIF